MMGRMKPINNAPQAKAAVKKKVPQKGNPSASDAGTDNGLVLGGVTATAIAADLPKRNQRETLRARLKIWWRELDHTLLGLIILLMAVGCAAISAASPAGGARASP